MEGIGFLTVLSGSMFLGSYLAGSIPMMFNMSESRMRMVSIFGAGLLLGTALSVIIPEGVESLYNGVAERNLKELRQKNDPTKAKVTLVDTKTAGNESPPVIFRASVDKNGDGDTGNHKAWKKRDIRISDSVVPQESVKDKRSSENGGQSVVFSTVSGHEHIHPYKGAHHQIGYPLVFGFVFMLLVDQISTVAGSRNDRSGRNRIGMSATIGLVVHAAADGVALGSTSTTNKSDVQLIVFIAIMLHKGPAAFGLVSFLLLEGIDARNARKHLLVFSCAAPFAAMLTFVILGSLGRDSMSSSESSTGMLMLFSAGTFLFVATVHVLPELANHSKSGKDYSLVIDAQSPATAGHSHSGDASFSIKELAAIILGAFVPTVLSSGHSH
ncbi:hypothetical protein KIN20_019853 [Parelaphostrongylus tenuis]|nr:hypothetical protein KIN20_019853 [Parelaphostrongylus tenuis]